MLRRISRILAFQALYSWYTAKIPIDNLLSFSWIENKADSDVNNNEEDDNVIVKSMMDHFEHLPQEKKDEIFIFAKFLAVGTVEHIDEIDAVIKKHLSSKWKIDRINKVALSVIRFSVYTLLYQKDTHPSIVIDEAVEIVKEYGTDEAYKFTNAILDNISKNI